MVGEYADGAAEPRTCWEKVHSVPGQRLVGTDPDRYSLGGNECAVSG
jgi:hypothetical protein